MPVFAVTYTYDDRTEVRMQARPEHRAFLSDLYDDGVLLAAGAWADQGQPGGLLALRAATVAEVEAALDDDPYRRAGVLAGREIREWSQLYSPWSG
jgi:uncharacterized protein YciI